MVSKVTSLVLQAEPCHQLLLLHVAHLQAHPASHGTWQTPQTLGLTAVVLCRDEENFSDEKYFSDNQESWRKALDEVSGIAGLRMQQRNG
jgi:hypothetical protein